MGFGKRRSGARKRDAASPKKVEPPGTANRPACNYDLNYDYSAYADEDVFPGRFLRVEQKPRFVREDLNYNGFESYSLFRFRGRTILRREGNYGESLPHLLTYLPIPEGCAAMDYAKGKPFLTEEQLLRELDGAQREKIVPSGGAAQDRELVLFSGTRPYPVSGWFLRAVKLIREERRMFLRWDIVQPGGYGMADYRDFRVELPEEAANWLEPAAVADFLRRDPEKTEGLDFLTAETMTGAETMERWNWERALTDPEVMERLREEVRRADRSVALGEAGADIRRAVSHTRAVQTLLPRDACDQEDRGFEGERVLFQLCRTDDGRWFFRSEELIPVVESDDCSVSRRWVRFLKPGTVREDGIDPEKWRAGLEPERIDLTWDSGEI